jgi:hypothetical protein
MKSKIFLLLIIKVKNIHEFNVLNLSLWMFSTKNKIILHWHTTMLSPHCKSYLRIYKHENISYRIEVLLECLLYEFHKWQKNSLEHLEYKD